MTRQQELRKVVEKHVGKSALCYYNNKRRAGRVVKVMQGPVYKRKRSNEFSFANMPNGEVYVEWKGAGKPVRTYKWNRVSGFRIGYPPPTKDELTKRAADMKALAAQQLANRIESARTRPVIVRRPRPTIGGKIESK